MIKPKRRRSIAPLKVLLTPANDGTNSPVPVPGTPITSTESEAALYKQAENPLGDPHKS